jgi:lipopolysaccharide export LptBFGC system permease protein LptF
MRYALMRRGERPRVGGVQRSKSAFFRQGLEFSVIPSRLQRYVLWEIIPVIGISAVALTAIFFLGLSVSFTREGLSVVQIYYVVPYILMLSLPYALPASFLLGAVLVFGRLSSRHEIDAMRASGVNVNHIIVPPLALALAVCCGTFFMNQYFFPWTLERVTRLRSQLINDVAEMVGQSPKNGYRVDPYYIYIGGADPKDHSWKSVALIQFADEIPSWFVWAKRGVWKRTDADNATLMLEDGVMMEPRLSEVHLKADETRPMVRFKKTTIHIPLNAGGGPSMKPKFLPLGALLERIRQDGRAAAETREELGRATRRPKTEFWKAKGAFEEADQKYAALAKVLGEKKGKLDEARSALEKLEVEVRADHVVQENAQKRCQEAKALLADQAEYLEDLQDDIERRTDEEDAPEQLAPLKEEWTRTTERVSQLTKRVAELEKELQNATAVLQAADARRLAASAAFANAETDYKAAETAANTAAEERSRLDAVRKKLDGIEHWIDAQCEFHFRNAGAATCFIFMLIGIPLGILSRRGSFIVALAISFCAVLFIHYPLMMIGETFAADGYLSPWLAEWMANGVLGCIGLGLLVWGVKR